MQFGEVKTIGKRWVSDNAWSLPGFLGAFFIGSICDAQDEAEFQASSDIDIALVFEGDPPGGATGKLQHDGLILDISQWSVNRLRPVERVLGDYRLAHNCQASNLICDLSGELRELAARVSSEFSKRRWVSERVMNARANCLQYVDLVSRMDNQFERVIAWLFAAGITTHIILAAGLKNPTIRKRYLAARNVLAEYGRVDFYESLLILQGSNHLDRLLTQRYLDDLIEVFDVACACKLKPFPHSSEINRIVRPITIDGTQELIDRGFHRESIFWIVASYARCMRVLENTGEATYVSRFRPGFEHLIGDLGITGNTILPRTEAVRGSIPPVLAVAEAIVESHPEIEGGRGCLD